SVALPPLPPSFPTRRSSDLRRPAAAALRRPAQERAGPAAADADDRWRRPPPGLGMFITFFLELRRAGVPVSLKEYLTLLQALSRDRKSTRLNSSHEWISYAV